MSENQAGGGEEGDLGMPLLYLLLRHVQTAHSDADVLPPTEGRFCGRALGGGSNALTCLPIAAQRPSREAGALGRRLS